METVHDTDVVFETLAAMGLRATVGKCMMDADDQVPARLRERTQHSIDESLAIRKRWDGAAGGRLRAAFAPRFAVSCSMEMLRESADLARSTGAYWQTHIAEDRREIDEVLDLFPGAIDYTDVYDRAGGLGPKAILGHAIYLSERELSRLKPGQPAQVNVDAAPGQAFIGRVARLSPVVDPATATFKVTVEVDDPSARLKPGMFARIGIVYERREGALQIPRNAIVDDEGQATVFIVQQGKAEQRPIGVGLSNAGYVEVTSGLQGQEQVVIVGQGALGVPNEPSISVVALPLRCPQTP